jgi:hypothetical protein
MNTVVVIPVGKSLLTFKSTLLVCLRCHDCQTPHPLHGKDVDTWVDAESQVRFTCRYCGAVNWYVGDKLHTCYKWKSIVAMDRMTSPPRERLL